MEKGEKSKYLDWYYIEKFHLKVKEERFQTTNVLATMGECLS